MSNIELLRKELDSNKVTSKELFDKSVSEAKKYQDEYNLFVTIMDKYEALEKNSILSGIPYSLKDNYSTSGILTTASSNILNNYVPVFDATVYKKLKDSGAVLMGKTVLDELAMGGTGTTGATGIVRNPWDKNRLIGGSSAGSAASVALGITPFSIGSDTGDSVRKPAAFGGVVGFKPTYGRISRYGLFAFASSLDHVGIFARNVKDVSIVTDVLKGYDEFDLTTLPDEDIKYSDGLDKDVKGKKLFYFSYVCDKEFYKENDEVLNKTLDNFKETIKKCESLGIKVEEVDFDKELLNALYPTYMSISCAEATSNNANLMGIQFGPRSEGKTMDEVIFNARTKGFSEFIKRRFILGSFILQKENQEKLFLNACRIRRIVVEKLRELFKQYDGLIMPASGGVAPKFGEWTDVLSDKYLILENHLCIANFGGFPSISIPNGFVNNMPTSVNITCKEKEDMLTLNIANKLESVMEYKNQTAGGEE